MHVTHLDSFLAQGRPTTLASSPEPSTGLFEAIDQIVIWAHDQRVAQERRTNIRHPFPFLVRAIPADRLGNRLPEPALTVIGKHVSFEGFGFFHTTPLAHRHVVVEFTIDPEDPPIRLLLDLIWCRFLREGWYDSGGRFVKVLRGEPNEGFPTVGRSVDQENPQNTKIL